MQYSVDNLKAGRQLWQSELPPGPQATDQSDQAGCVGTPWMSELKSSGGGMACRQESAGAELLSVPCIGPCCPHHTSFPVAGQAVLSLELSWEGWLLLYTTKNPYIKVKVKVKLLLGGGGVPKFPFLGEFLSLIGCILGRKGFVLDCSVDTIRLFTYLTLYGHGLCLQKKKF